MWKKNPVKLRYHWDVSADSSDASFVLDFELQPNDIYMCYVMPWGDEPDWDQAVMLPMRFDYMHQRDDLNQPQFSMLSTDEDPMMCRIRPGRALVVPFKQVGCQWPPHRGEDTWK